MIPPKQLLEEHVVWIYFLKDELSILFLSCRKNNKPIIGMKRLKKVLDTRTYF